MTLTQLLLLIVPVAILSALSTLLSQRIPALRTILEAGDARTWLLFIAHYVGSFVGGLVIAWPLARTLRIPPFGVLADHARRRARHESSSGRPRYDRAAVTQQSPTRWRPVPVPAEPTPPRPGWRAAYWTLLVAFLVTAALNLAKVRAGFLTSHAADLVTPAWLYVVLRRLADPASTNRLYRLLGATPELAAVSLFLASAATEVSQLYWPRGPFAGVFDPLDLVAYAAGLSVCYVADRRQSRTAAQPGGRRRAFLSAGIEPVVGRGSSIHETPQVADQGPRGSTGGRR